MKWERGLGMTNFILCSDGLLISERIPPFWISYNPVLAETALCNGKDYYILNGDYRATYEKLVPQGWDVCKEFFDKQSKHGFWSD